MASGACSKNIARAAEAVASIGIAVASIATSFLLLVQRILQEQEHQQWQALALQWQALAHLSCCLTPRALATRPLLAPIVPTNPPAVRNKPKHRNFFFTFIHFIEDSCKSTFRDLKEGEKTATYAK